VAVRFNTGLCAHAVGLDIDKNGNLVGQVPGFGGGVMASIYCPDHRPQMATIRPGVLKKTEKKTGKRPVIEDVKVNLKEQQIRTKVIKVSDEKPSGINIKDADVIIAGGYGIGSKENWKMLEELASATGGSVGATRPPLEEGWAQEEQMIGASGITVHPSLYVGVGISGDMHHIIGAKDSKIIVAINKDPNAAIFKLADYGIVGDFRQIVPLLIEELKS
jgi:electron transfer flavoprotein alpha subunit